MKDNWHENSEKPKFEGEYLVTILEAQICSTRGGSSYAWVTTTALFNGEEWEMDGVLAWAEMPEPYFTSDETKVRQLMQNAMH